MLHSICLRSIPNRTHVQVHSHQRAHSRWFSSSINRDQYQTKSQTKFAPSIRSSQQIRCNSTETESLATQQRKKLTPAAFITDTDKLQKEEKIETQQVEESSSPFKAVKDLAKFTSLIQSVDTTILTSASELYMNIQQHVERDDIYELYALDREYMPWFRMSMLHIWMVLVRLRLDGQAGEKMSQALFDSFWQDTESRMIGMGITNALTISKEQKLLARIYYASVVSYDEALLEGDAQMADALWRNVYEFKVDPEIIPKLHSMVHYVKKQLENLDKLDSKIIFSGNIKFDSQLIPTIKNSGEDSIMTVGKMQENFKLKNPTIPMAPTAPKIDLKIQQNVQKPGEKSIAAGPSGKENPRK